ncbi:unnamed protein product [Alopecurus aequalis]
MASHEAPSPQPPPAPTTISALTDDLLREIFLRLPDLPTLACAAFACRAFLRAVRPSPAFRRFRELHAPPILALFIEPYMRAFVPAVSRMSGTGMTGAFADLLRGDGSSEWRNDSEVPYSDGYVSFVNRNTKQNVWYNVHTQALDMCPKKSHVDLHTFLEFHTLPADRDDLRPCRVVCVHHDRSWVWARVAVFSSHAMEWQVFPGSGTPLLEGGRHTSVIDGFVYLSVDYGGDPQSWFLSVCLEIAEVNFLFKRTCSSSYFDPYIMAWPPSLIHNKDSETEVTGDGVGDNGRVGKEEASPVLFTTLRSFKESLIDDDNVKFADMDAFLLDDEINSLQNKITTLEAGFAAVRNHILRIGAHSGIYKKWVERESWWQMCKGMLRRARSCFLAS